MKNANELPPFLNYKLGVEQFMFFDGNKRLLTEISDYNLLKCVKRLKRNRFEYDKSWVLVIEDILLNRRINKIKKLKENINVC